MSKHSRPPIPVTVRRAVLVEAGHKCAIPHCGHGDVDIHHIVPWETCGKHEYANLISLCPNCHRRAHKGEIDRKSLRLYKADLVASFQISGEALFSAPAVEIKRCIREVDSASASCAFSFEFPDFVDPVTRIVSKNIEAWGLELLAVFRYSQDAAQHRDLSKQDDPMCWLIGSYQVCRRDVTVISVRYDIERMAFGAVHRSYETRVQNFFVNPFSPIVLEEILESSQAIEQLAKAVRIKLLRGGALDPIDVEAGTAPDFNVFSKFVVDQYGLNFMFDPYQVASYAQGVQQAHLSFEELGQLLKMEKIAALARPD